MKSCTLGLIAAPYFATAITALADIRIEPIGVYESRVFDEGAAEIVAHDPATQRLFVSNSDANSVDVIDIGNPAEPKKMGSIDASSYGGGVNSVAVRGGIVAIAVENENKQLNGKIVFFDTQLKFLSAVEVGALPDMVTFTPNGQFVIVANEGEPNDDYTVDPEGSVSIISISGDIAGLDQSAVKTATFTALNGTSLDPSIRVFGPRASVAQDMEPEFITVSSDSKTAWVTCQENNAIARIDIDNARVAGLYGLGFKDHNLTGNGIDASDKDEKINIKPWPVKGIFMPDAIASYEAGGKTFLITANEGDAREYEGEGGGFVEEQRVEDLELDPSAFPDAQNLQKKDALGRLKVTTTLGKNSEGKYEALYSFGARSFSIWSDDGKLVFDSGDAIEQKTAASSAKFFNSSNDETEFDGRSSSKGPEPEGLVVGKVNGKTYAFIGLERIGGIMVYSVEDPTAPEFVEYVNTRDFSADPKSSAAGDLGPEGMVLIDQENSPNGASLLVVGNEVSGTTRIYQIHKK